MTTTKRKTILPDIEKRALSLLMQTAHYHPEQYRDNRDLFPDSLFQNPDFPAILAVIDRRVTKGLPCALNDIQPDCPLNPGVMAELWTAETRTDSEMAEHFAAQLREARAECKIAALFADYATNTSATAPYLSYVSKTMNEMLPTIEGGNDDFISAADWWTDDPEEIDRMSTEALVRGIARRGELLQVVGGAKTWKTWLGIHLAISIATGAEFLGMFPATKARVGYLDFELKAGELRKRLCFLAAGPPDGMELKPRGNDKASMSDLRRWIRRRKWEVVFIDSLYKTGWILEENDNVEVAARLEDLQTIAEETGALIVIIDHTVKGGGMERSVVDSSRGASSKGGSVDAILQTLPFDGPEPNLITIKTVVRSFPPMPEVPVIRVVTGPHSLIFERTDHSSTDTKPDLLGQPILEILAEEGSCDFKTIRHHLEKRQGPTSEASLRRALERLEPEDKIGKRKDPKDKRRVLYSLPDLAD